MPATGASADGGELTLCTCASGCMHTHSYTRERVCRSSGQETLMLGVWWPCIVMCMCRSRLTLSFKQHTPTPTQPAQTKMSHTKSVMRCAHTATKAHSDHRGIALHATHKMATDRVQQVYYCRITARNTRTIGCLALDMMRSSCCNRVFAD